MDQLPGIDLNMFSQELIWLLGFEIYEQINTSVFSATVHCPDLRGSDKILKTMHSALICFVGHY